MWALRRASHPLKSRGFTLGTSRVCSAKLDLASRHPEAKALMHRSTQSISNRCRIMMRLGHDNLDAFKFSMCSCGLSSQAGAKSSDEEDNLEDGFSELETPAGSDTVQGNTVEDENDDELISEPDLSEEDDELDASAQEMQLSDTEMDVIERKSQQKTVRSVLLKAILAAPGSSIHPTLDRWVEEGNEISRTEATIAMLNLRKRRMYMRALQLSEWLEAKKPFDLIERDYASRVDLIAKVRGLLKAESYVEKMPQNFRGEVIYRTLLANCVKVSNVKKAEELFNKMKDLEFPVSSFSCNQLLLLYKRLDKKKIADVLLLMEKENVKPSLFTYRLLIDTKGQSNDIKGMDQIVETMKAEGIEPDIRTQALLAKHYVAAELNEKAEGIMKEIEGGNLKENRWACRILLPLYAALGKADEVGRIWKVCESNPFLDECLAAIEAWGNLDKVEDAEAVFDKMLSTCKRPPSRCYSTMLKVYADHKMLAKGKDLVKRMADNGGKIGPLTWDALVKLYVEAGEVEKADSILQKAAQQNQLRPMFSSYMAVMDQYSKRGDVHNAEKMFHRMRQVGYFARLRQFQALAQAYINANAPAYGMRERMKADNIFPNRPMAAQLAQLDPFKKTAVSDLLD
ncbi:Pentatricopeptide repeat [Dillenia turbinata]|uniref:Pentatricopeptide repeat n=1 Tax=Dillenia turbinata TaxID=194707 RepID=A0AAN8ZI82_9MAGN